MAPFFPPDLSVFVTKAKFDTSGPPDLPSVWLLFSKIISAMVWSFSKGHSDVARLKETHPHASREYFTQKNRFSVTNHLPSLQVQRTPSSSIRLTRPPIRAQ